MPRFLTLWLDYGAEVAHMQQQCHPHGENVRHTGGTPKSTFAEISATFDEVQKVRYTE